jgi:arylsulfatase A-like enzyme
VYGNSHLLRPDAETLPQLFRKHGYHTIGVGKVFHREDVGIWDEIVKVEGKNPTPAKRPVNGIPDARHFDWATLDVKDDEMRDGKFANRIIKMFQKNHQKPFFLAWGIGANHLPYYVPQEYFDLYPLEGITLPEVKPDDLDDVPPIGRLLADTEGKFWWSVHGGDHRAVTAHGQWERAVQGYLATLSFCDALVGRVLDALASSPYRDNTLIVFISDQGTHLGEKRHWRKHTLWEESLHIPMIFSGMDIQEQAFPCPRTVSLLDVCPTLIDLCGLSRNEELEGKSLRKLLEHPSYSWDRPVISTYGKNNHSVRSERWRYTRYEDGTEELYDHDVDPMEWENLSEVPSLTSVKQEMAAWFPVNNAEDAVARTMKRSMRSGNKWEYLG